MYASTRKRATTNCLCIIIAFVNGLNRNQELCYYQCELFLSHDYVYWTGLCSSCTRNALEIELLANFVCACLKRLADERTCWAICWRGWTSLIWLTCLLFSLQYYSPSSSETLTETSRLAVYYLLRIQRKRHDRIANDKLFQNRKYRPVKLNGRSLTKFSFGDKYHIL